MTCPTCEGEGVVEVMTASQCTQPISNCCGGCSREEACPTCDGHGSVGVVRCSRCQQYTPAPLAVPGAQVAPDLGHMMFCQSCADHLLAPKGN